MTKLNYKQGAMKTDLWSGNIFWKKVDYETSELSKEWIRNALDDGWAIRSCEKSDRIMYLSLLLEKEGYKINYSLFEAYKTIFLLFFNVTRVDKNGEFNVWISIYGDDGLAITVPNEYDWEFIKENRNTCMECGAVGKTGRLGVAGRGCLNCVQLFNKGVLV